MSAKKERTCKGGVGTRQKERDTATDGTLKKRENMPQVETGKMGSVKRLSFGERGPLGENK